jgi:hypothetical protein
LAATQAMLVKIRATKLPLESTFSKALPQWCRAFDEVLLDFEAAVRTHTPDLADSIVQVARELCHPDPGRRGDAKSRKSVAESNFALQRYISRFDLLAKKAEYKLK